VPDEAAAGDHLQAEYHLWLVGDQLEHGRVPWRDPYTFRPESPPRWNFGGWPFGLPFWPLHVLFGPVLGWNLFLLLTYLAAGGLAYLWLRELGLPRGAALAGGLVFALAPYRVAQSAGHLRGPISALLPLALWAFERSRGSRWWLVAAGAALASIPFSDVHLSLGAIPFFLLYALCRSRDRLALGGAAAATGIAIAAALVVGHFAVSGSIGSGGRSLREVAHYSASGLDFVTRHPRHGLESFVFLGWVTPLLALAGLVVLVRGRRHGLALALAVGAVVPILLALGTHFPLYSTLWHHFPPLRYPRVPERQMPVACLALAALAAFAVARVRVALAVAGLLLVLAADLRVTGVYDAAAADRRNTAYATLRGAPPGRLLEVPVLDPSVQLGSIYLWYNQEARRERPGGYSTIAPRAAARLALRLQELNCGDWRRGTDELLRSLGVRYVAFHRGLAGPRGWFAWRALQRHGFGQLARDGAVSMLERGRAGATPPAAEPTQRIVFCEGWDGRSPRYRHAAFWARGAVRMRLTTRDPVRTTVSIDRKPIRLLQVRSAVALRVRTGPGWHVIGIDVDRADRGLTVEPVSG
jgi:hypothetical protein